jgi:hypothetical protein
MAAHSLIENTALCAFLYVSVLRWFTKAEQMPD